MTHAILYSKAPRPAPEFLNSDLYPHRFDVQVRFQDLDPLGHVNNVALAALFEDVRVRAVDTLDLWRFQKSMRFVSASVELAYLKEVSRDHPLIFYFGIGYIGSKSWREHALGVQEESVAFVGSATHVLSDKTGPCTLSSELIETLSTARLRLPALSDQ